MKKDEQYDWEPGDLAMVRSVNGTERLALRGCRAWHIAYLDGPKPHVERLADGATYATIASARPLLPLDPSSMAQMVELAKAVRAHGYQANMRGPGKKANIAKAVASLLKQPLPPPPPPKPAEPAGLGAVVTDACGAHYVRVESGDKCTRWRRQAHGGLYAWDEIDVPDADHVLSEGLDLGVSAP